MKTGIFLAAALVPVLMAVAPSYAQTDAACASARDRRHVCINSCYRSYPNGGRQLGGCMVQCPDDSEPCRVPSVSTRTIR